LNQRLGSMKEFSKVKNFLTSNKQSILSLAVFFVVVIYFAPKQNDYYLDTDINEFKSRYLMPTLMWVGIAASILFLVLRLVFTRSIKHSFLPFLYVSCVIAIFLFWLQSLFLAGALFINRQFNKGVVTRQFAIGYVLQKDDVLEQFFPYEVSTGRKFSYDEKLKKILYRPGLQQHDTISVNFGKGLLGIEYPLPVKK
jgi:hypothetical protein